MAINIFRYRTFCTIWSLILTVLLLLLHTCICCPHWMFIRHTMLLFFIIQYSWSEILFHSLFSSVLMNKTAVHLMRIRSKHIAFDIQSQNISNLNQKYCVSIKFPFYIGKKKYEKIKGHRTEMGKKSHTILFLYCQHLKITHGFCIFIHSIPHTISDLSLPALYVFTFSLIPFTFCHLIFRYTFLILVL